ncbi:MAG: putative beta-mannanase, partial [Frankiales bacterium]|nr:putative beta-mannanase [Frankiales bacterium]
MPAARLSAPLRALTALGLLTGLLAGLVAGAAPSSAATTGTALSGVYAGGIKVDAAQQFGTWRGKPVAVAGDFLPGGSWGEVEGPSWLLGAWSGKVDRLVLGVPILPGAKGSTTFAAGIAGSYDAHFTALARNLVDAGHDDAVLRLGWEMNGNWFPWSIIGHEAEFAAYFRRIVTTMRAVPGADFAFEYNPTLGAGSWGAKPDAAWPGDAYVDVIGLDVYDSQWGNSTMTPEARWSAVQNGTYALDWWADFAARHGGKPLGFPEWGLWETSGQNGGGGGDNPLFITKFLDWVDAHSVLYETYFNVTAHDGDHLLTNFPKAAAAYRAHVSGAAAAPAPATTTTAPAPTTTATTTAPAPATAPVVAGPPTSPTVVAPAPVT